MKKSNIGAIIRKEFNRFFTDRRLVMTAIILPGLMIYLLYSFMGSAMSDMYSVEDDFAPTVYAVNAPASIAALAQEAGMTLTDVSPQEAEGVRTQIVDKQAELLAVFPADFDAQVAAYAPGAGEAPNIELYYNSTDADSSQAHAMFAALLDGYESSLVNKFDVNRGVDADLASERDTAGQIFSSMLPLLMMVFLFSGCMAVAPESIAGEKERGSIATLLVTPLGRGELAMGKVISLGCISLLSGASSFLGTMLSLPKLMGAGDVALEAAAYGAGDYAALFAVIAHGHDRRALRLRQDREGGFHAGDAADDRQHAGGRDLHVRRCARATGLVLHPAVQFRAVHERRARLLGQRCGRGRYRGREPGIGRLHDADFAQAL